MTVGSGLAGFGARVAELLSANGMKQKHLAAACGVAPGVVSEWIGKNRVPEPPRLIKLADTLGASIDYLLTGRQPQGIDRLIEGLDQLLGEAERIRRGGTASVQEGEPEESFPDRAVRA